jgi:hypothetical protein
MIRGHIPSQDLESFQRWAIAVDDQLREAIDAVLALEDPELKRGSFRRGTDLLSSSRRSSDLANDVLDDLRKFKENPNRPAWFTPACQMWFGVAICVSTLLDYVEALFEQPPEHDSRILEVFDDKVQPALDHYREFRDALTAAGYLS